MRVACAVAVLLAVVGCGDARRPAPRSPDAAVPHQRPRVRIAKRSGSLAVAVDSIAFSVPYGSGSTVTLGADLVAAGPCSTEWAGEFDALTRAVFPIERLALHVGTARF